MEVVTASQHLKRPVGTSLAYRGVAACLHHLDECDAVLDGHGGVCATMEDEQRQLGELAEGAVGAQPW